MLEKLRSRHPIDVPADEWGTRKPTLAIMGLLAVLFVLLPLLGALYAGAVSFPLAIGVAVGALVLVLLFAAARGKPGHKRR